jgi:hypothetical protein
MGRCNPRHFFPVYTCGRHRNSNIPTAMKIPTHLGFTATAAAPLRLLHPVHRRASAIERGGLQNRRPQQSCIGRGRIRFLEAIFVIARSLRQVLHHGSSTSSSVSRRVIAFNANFVRPIVVFIRSSSSRNRKSRLVPALKTCLTYLIC